MFLTIIPVASFTLNFVRALFRQQKTENGLKHSNRVRPQAEWNKNYATQALFPPRDRLSVKIMSRFTVLGDYWLFGPYSPRGLYTSRFTISDRFGRGLYTGFYRNQKWDFFRLKVLNLAQNALVTLPPLNPFQDLNKVQHLVLSANRFNDSVFQIILGYRRLKCLDLAYNHLKHIDNRWVKEPLNLNLTCLSLAKTNKP